MRSDSFRLDIPVEHFTLFAVLMASRSWISIPATLKFLDAPGGSI